MAPPTAGRVAMGPDRRLLIYRHQVHPIAALIPAIHPLAVEHEGRIALRIHPDHPPLAIDGDQLLMHHDLHGRLQAEPLIFHQTADIMRRHRPDEHLPMTRTGDATGPVICIRSGADDRAIPDATILFVGHTARTDRRGDITLLVASHPPDTAEFFIPHPIFPQLMSI